MNQLLNSWGDIESSHHHYRPTILIMWKPFLSDCIEVSVFKIKKKSSYIPNSQLLRQYPAVIYIMARKQVSCLRKDYVKSVIFSHD